MDMNDVRAGLAAALGGLGFSPYPALPGSPDLPAAIVNAPIKTDYHQDIKGRSLITLPVTLIVSLADFESAQTALNTAISYKPGGLIQSLEASAKVHWTSLMVVSSGPFVTIELGEAKGLAVDLTLQLLA
jgi:hypothetical protein